MQDQKSIEANRQAWNEVAPIHAKHQMKRLLDDLRTPDVYRLDDVERDFFNSVKVQGKAVVQLCCNNGRELMSVKKLGAGRCVGVDIAESFIEQARQLAQDSGLACEFVCANVLDLASDYDGTFDIVYITIGALCWIPDLGALFEIVNRLLKPGGHLFIYDMHPFLNVFEVDDPEGVLPTVKLSYFPKGPYPDTHGLDYFGNTDYGASVHYWYSHKLSNVIGGCLQHGLGIEHFEEYPYDISNIFKHFEKLPIQLPLCYTLVATK
jgi:ubiquinone/menaquinone biosynthesis C-methylase UbiE